MKIFVIFFVLGLGINGIYGLVLLANDWAQKKMRKLNQDEEDRARERLKEAREKGEIE